MTSEILKAGGNWIPQTRRSGEWVLNVLIASFFTAAVIFLYMYQYSIHYDLAGASLSGKLAGELGDEFDRYSLYFPPAERIWYSAVAQIQSITNWRLDLVAVSLTSLMVFISASFAYFIRRNTVGATPLFFVVSLAALLFLPIVFKNIFGLREHLVVLGLWPYLVFRISDPSGKKLSLTWRIVLGVWLGSMLLFKYFYAVVVLMVELLDAALQKRGEIVFRIENVIAGSVVCLYLLLWLGLDPTAREALLAMKSALGANVIDWQQNLTNVAMHTCLALAFLVMARISRANFRLTLIGFAVVVGAIAVTALQARWYTHHLFPIFLANILMFWMVGKNLSFMLKIAVFVLLAHTGFKQFQQIDFYQNWTKNLQASLESNSVSFADKRIALFNAHPSPFNQVIAQQGGFRWSPFVNIAHVATALKEKDVLENAGTPNPPIHFDEPEQKKIQQHLMQLMVDSPPDIIIMDHSTNWPLNYLTSDWKSAFSNDDRFTKLLDGYRLSYSHSDEFLKYDLYVPK